MTSAKQLCRRKPNWELLDHRGITEDPGLTAGVAAGRAERREAVDQREQLCDQQGGETEQLDFRLWQVRFSLFLSFAVCREFFRGESRPFSHTTGFTRKRQHSNTASRTGRRRQTEFLIDRTFTSAAWNRSLHLYGGDVRLADELLIGVSQRRLTDTQIALCDNIRLSTADQLEHFLFHLLRLNPQLSGCQP